MIEVCGARFVSSFGIGSLLINNIITMNIENIEQQVTDTCRRLLSEQNKDPYSKTYGCFDRRYWAWKLVDFPEATYQRNVYPLAWLYSKTTDPSKKRMLAESVIAGLRYSFSIQHKDGSFDQAFPNEHSWGATAFLLNSLVEAYCIIKDECDEDLRKIIGVGLRKAANFLCKHDEMHGFIANHVAGAALALFELSDYFNDEKYEARAKELLDRVILGQSDEGWFPEYQGADPGYQTLCFYYLTKVHSIRPNEALSFALKKAIEFLAAFIHPDGTFGGEYGSRRTSIYYPGGIATMGQNNNLASAITHFMLRSISEGKTITLKDVDIGNIAPIISNYIELLNCKLKNAQATQLPWQDNNYYKVFHKAGICVRSTHKYYAVIGMSNGGVIKCFDKEKKRLINSDFGYVGTMINGKFITTQMTNLKTQNVVSKNQIKIETPFYLMNRVMPTPDKFLVLRLLNLTVMRFLRIGNAIKRKIVKRLINTQKEVPLSLSRTIKFESNCIVMSDKISMKKDLEIKSLEHGRPFLGIHMASAGYHEDATAHLLKNKSHFIDIQKLNSTGEITSQLIFE